MPRTLAALVIALISVASVFPPVAGAQTAATSLEKVAAALGAKDVRSLEIAGSGTIFAIGQNATPTMPWPRFNLKSFARSINYETASLRDELVRTQALDPPRGGSQQPVRGEQRQIFVVSGEHAWNVVGDVNNPVPVALAERQIQIWMTPHGVVKAAVARSATVRGRTITFDDPARYRMKVTVDLQNLVALVEAVVPHPVLGDLPIEVRYLNYRDFGGVKFPTKIQQFAGGFPILELAVTDVRPNAAVTIEVPDTVRAMPEPYARVTSQMVADGVWFLSGGTHNSALIEMKDHLILVESPINDQRALAVLAEVKSLVPSKPIRYLVNSHHHFDHAGGVRAVAGEGVTVITHEVNRAFLERAVAARATVRPDHLAKAGRTAKVEGVRDQRVLTDGTRTVEIRHIAGNLHHDGLIMVYLPREKILIEADAYTPLPLNATPPTAANANPYTVNLADNLKKQNLDVEQVLPLHGRIVPVAELHKAAGH